MSLQAGLRNTIFEQLQRTSLLSLALRKALSSSSSGYSALANVCCVALNWVEWRLETAMASLKL